MPADTKNYDDIKKYQESAIAKQSEGASLESGAFVLGDKVMEAVRADRVQRGTSKLATDVGNVMGQMVSDPNQIRASTSGMVDPFSVNALTSSARAQNLRTLGTVATQEGQNQGTIDEVIQSGANQLKARAQSLYAQAQQEEQKAQALQQEWERMMAEREMVAKEKSAGAGSASDNAFAQMVKDILGMQEGTPPGQESGELDLSDEASYVPQTEAAPFSVWEGTKTLLPNLGIPNILANAVVPGAGSFMNFLSGIKKGKK